MKNFVDCNWLNKRLNDESLFILDCRFDLFDSTYGSKAYGEDHIQNAHFLDINSDLSGKQGAHGGARPMPDLIDLVKKLENIGLTMTSTIVCYDDQTYSSGRAWWQLKKIGFEKVYILNGGYQHWQKLQYPTTVALPRLKQNGKIIVNTRRRISCDMDYVKQAINSHSAILMDSREEKRFTGAYEPLYSKNGHIPSSINVHWKKNIAPDGQLEPPTKLASNFSHIDKTKEIITYCGSGIDGALNFVILNELGYNVKLYVGSVSDWISYEDNPLEIGPAKPLY